MPEFAWSNMFVTPQDDPRSGGHFADERALLTGYLRDHRLTLELKCAGLSPEQLALRSVPPSTMSLLGLVRHLANVEAGWFRGVMAGQEGRVRPFRHGDDRDEEWRGAVGEQAAVDEAWSRWREEVAFADAWTAEHDLLTRGARDEELTLRELLLHLIEEYARHNGHADLLRERIDGRVGQ
ncbi:Mini-circle uncharacterized 19.1 kDa protein [Nostocoides japonicum T1-X7]|uniref:Mini-circle uncharacterized 19.1 kDa protein n=1 Tax=Nostocoides japonicum T1-X7 TaxID=1194083 RepID=A0A077M6T0_9MICO|nr:DinB family protein [Tetrasphaera japonica]CCH79740.1 Mini-circle uncharacterized 19.1 kDa protein [Tetrasphaera japonica T1-X7]